MLLISQGFPSWAEGISMQFDRGHIERIWNLQRLDFIVNIDLLCRTEHKYMDKVCRKSRFRSGNKAKRYFLQEMNKFHTHIPVCAKPNRSKKELCVMAHFLHYFLHWTRHDGKGSLPDFLKLVCKDDRPTYIYLFYLLGLTCIYLREGIILSELRPKTAVTFSISAASAIVCHLFCCNSNFLFLCGEWNSNEGHFLVKMAN